MRPFRIALPFVVALPLAAPAQARDRARVWMTTGDKANLLTEQPRASMGAPAAGLPTITVDPSHALPAHGGLRRLDHRLLGPPDRASRRSATRSCATCSTAGTASG